MLVDAGTRVHEGSGWDDLVENEMVAPSPPPPIPPPIPLTPPYPYPTPLKVVLVFVCLFFVFFWGGSLYFELLQPPASPLLAHVIPLAQGFKKSHQLKLSCLHVLATKFCESIPI